MKYMYTAKLCANCIKLKKEYNEKGIEYVERDSKRLKSPSIDRDDIDVDALVQLSIQNMELPVVVEKDG